jgi:hypothetical protein
MQEAYEKGDTARDNGDEKGYRDKYTGKRTRENGTESDTDGEARMDTLGKSRKGQTTKEAKATEVGEDHKVCGREAKPHEHGRDRGVIENRRNTDSEQDGTDGSGRKEANARQQISASNEDGPLTASDGTTYQRRAKDPHSPRQTEAIKPDTTEHTGDGMRSGKLREGEKEQQQEEEDSRRRTGGRDQDAHRKTRGPDGGDYQTKWDGSACTNTRRQPSTSTGGEIPATDENHTKRQPEGKNGGIRQGEGDARAWEEGPPNDPHPADGRQLSKTEDEEKERKEDGQRGGRERDPFSHTGRKRKRSKEAGISTT